MKIALILAGNIWRSPYLTIYTKILDQLDVHYDVISWNRDGLDKKYGIQYVEPFENDQSHIKKQLPFLRYAFFVKKVLRRQQYDKLIVFNSQLAIALSTFLIIKYSGRYILDYRDLSIEQNSCLKAIYKLVLDKSAGNVISSPGFISRLPKGNYFISHNFDIDVVRNSLNSRGRISHCENNLILTIGMIRNYSSNIQVIEGLANDSKYSLSFVGHGPDSEKIEQFVHEHNISNVNFRGYYEKSEELSIVENSTFINIYYPRNPSMDTSLSNRFYNALLCRKPMITTTGTIHADYVERFDLGISVENCDNLHKKLDDFSCSLDYFVFANNCDMLLNSFVDDYIVFENMVKKFICE